MPMGNPEAYTNQQRDALYTNVFRAASRGDEYALRLIAGAKIRAYESPGENTKQLSALSLIYDPKHHDLLFRHPNIVQRAVRDFRDHEPRNPSIKIWDALSSLAVELQSFEATPAMLSTSLRTLNWDARTESLDRLSRKIGEVAIDSTDFGDGETQAIEMYSQLYKWLSARVSDSTNGSKLVFSLPEQNSLPAMLTDVLKILKDLDGYRASAAIDPAKGLRTIQLIQDISQLLAPVESTILKLILFDIWLLEDFYVS